MSGASAASALLRSMFDAPDSPEPGVAAMGSGGSGSPQGLMPVKVEAPAPPASWSEPKSSPKKSQAQSDAGSVVSVSTSPGSAAAATARGEGDMDVDSEGPGGAEDLCTLCGKRPKQAKNRHCKVCKSDVQAARRETEVSGNGQWFASLYKKGGEEFLDFMHTYVRNSSTRRKYGQRARFDFVQYREARRIPTAFRLGFKAAWGPGTWGPGCQC